MVAEVRIEICKKMLMLASLRATPKSVYFRVIFFPQDSLIVFIHEFTPKRQVSKYNKDFMIFSHICLRHHGGDASPGWRRICFYLSPLDRCKRTVPGSMLGCTQLRSMLCFHVRQLILYFLRFLRVRISILSYFTNNTCLNTCLDHSVTVAVQDEICVPGWS